MNANVKLVWRGGVLHKILLIFLTRLITFVKGRPVGTGKPSAIRVLLSSSVK